LSNVSYDVAVIGGGPGGYAAALRAAELNLKVVVIEKDKIGGTCLHRGCIPTTSLLESASVLETVNKSGKFGIEIEKVSYDWQNVQKSKKTAVNRLFMGLSTLFRQRKVNIIKGTATLREVGKIRIDGEAGTQDVTAPNIIIATGSKPYIKPELQLDKGVGLDTTAALEIDEIPKTIAIVGGGAYGVEFASLFRSFGSEVFIIESAPRLLPRGDKDISNYLEKAFSKRGIRIYTNTTVDKATTKNGAAEIELIKDGERQTMIADKILMTTGRAANTESIDLEELGLQTKDGFIQVDSNMNAGVDGIYAVGDVTYAPQFANFAFSEGIHAAEIIAGLQPPELNLKQIPIYTFGYPEIAKVGYTEEEAVKEGFVVESTSLPFQSISRSAIDKEDTGFIKMISIKDGPIIGIHMIGPNVVDLISEAMLITNWEATAKDMAQFLHPHPSFAEAIGETSLKLAGKPLHSL